MTDEQSTYSDEYIYTFMDAAGLGLPVDASSVELTEMQMRHNAFELEMTEAATEMLGITVPISDPQIVAVIEDAVRRIRADEVLPCKVTFPAAALGVLWGWHLVSRLKWQWRAVKKGWWETLAVADPENRYVILPVQYMRGIAGSDEIDKWPHDVIADIQAQRLPASGPNQLLRIC